MPRAPAYACGEAMCEECDDLEKKISRYHEFVRQGLDALTTERIKRLIEEMERRKAALH